MSFFTAIFNSLRRPSLPARPKRMFALTEGTDANVFVFRDETASHEPDEAMKPGTELGFGQSLPHEPVNREAAGNLGALLFSQGRTREALPLLERAELEMNDQTRSVATGLVDKAHQSLALTAPNQDPAVLDLLREQSTALQRVFTRLANLEQRLAELSEAMSRLAAAPATAPAFPAEPSSEVQKPRRPRASHAKARRQARSRSAASRRSPQAGVKQQRPS